MDPATAIQITSSLVDLVKLCGEGYVIVWRFIQTIKHMGYDVEDLDQRFKEEDTKLRIFAQAHNLIVDEARGTRADVAIDQPPLWTQTVLDRFVHVKDHLEIAEKIVRRYCDGNPNPSSPQSIVSPLSQATTDASSVSSVGAGGPVAGSGALLDLTRRPTETFRVLDAEIASKRRIHKLLKSPFTVKLKWAVKDKSALEEAITKLRADNEALLWLTMPNVLNLVFDAISSQFAALRIEINELNPLRPAASLDGQGSLWHREKQLFEKRGKPQQEARDLMASLDLETAEQKEARGLELARFPEIMAKQDWPNTRERLSTMLRNSESKGSDEVQVLVEWKECNRKVLTRDEAVARVSNVVAMLGSRPCILTNVLTALGFVEDSRTNARQSGWLGIVYETSALGYDPPRRTLRDLLAGTWKPPLGDRFRLGQRLAETLLQVHNCGWLHKGLRPENVVFFTRERSIAEPYLLGWDYSRPYRPGQKTETVMTGVGDAELYLHPDWFQQAVPAAFNAAGAPASRYRVEFDQYQLGCLLLEIGLWCLIGDLRAATKRTFSDDQDSRERWREYLETKTTALEPEVGAIYAGVVRNLLLGLKGKGLEFWHAVVYYLSQCQA